MAKTSYYESKLYQDIKGTLPKSKDEKAQTIISEAYTKPKQVPTYNPGGGGAGYQPISSPKTTKSDTDLTQEEVNQFKPGYIPTAEEIKNRPTTAKKIIAYQENKDLSKPEEVQTTPKTTYKGTSSVQSKPYGYYTKAPSTKQTISNIFLPQGENRFLSVVYAPVRALEFGGDVLSEEYLKSQYALQKAGVMDVVEKPVQSAGAVKFLGETTAYFTPAAPALLVSGGTKKVVEGKTIVEKGLGVAEIAGGIGVGVGMVKSVRSTRQAQLLAEAKTSVSGVRVETSEGGVDFLIGKKITQPKALDKALFIKKESFYTKAVQPFKSVGEGEKVVFESGEMFTYRVSKNKVDSMFFETGGRGYKADSSRYITQKKDIKAEIDLPYESGYGGYYVKPISKGQLKISKGRVDINTEKVTGSIDRGKFLGLSQETEGNIINILAAKPTKAKTGILSDVITIRGKPEVIGKIKRINLDSGKSSDIIGGVITKTTTKTAPTPTYSENIISKTYDYIAPKIKPPETINYRPPSYVSSGQIGVQKESLYYGKGSAETQIMIPKQEDLLKTKVDLIPLSLTESKVDQFQPPKFKTGLNQKDITGIKQTSSSGYDLRSKPQYFYKEGLDVIQKQPQKPKEKTKQVERSITQPYTPIRTTQTPTRFAFPLLPPILPKLNIFEGKRKTQSKGRKYSYTPSLAALGFRGTGFEKYFTSSKIPEGIITGIVTRPIIKKKKKKRKK